MKKTLAVCAALCLAGCEYDVREERLPPPYVPPTHDSVPMPVPSSPSKTPASTTTGDAGTSADGSASFDEDASAEPR